MNEHIDIALTGAKLAARDNEVASLTVHTISLTYNLAQLMYSRYMYLNCQSALATGAIQADYQQIEQYKYSSIKHTLLLALDATSLILDGITCLKQVDRF